MDHYGWDGKRANLIVSALGNDTVEIGNSWKRVRTITGLEHPQAAVYVPGTDRIAVSGQSGKLRFYDAESFALVKTLDFGTNADTDNMRYDPVSRRIYVGYGDGARGALAIVDPAAMERVEEFKLGSHPESCQLERDGSRIFVNLPDQGSIGVIEQKAGAVTKWKIPGHMHAHALALDEAGHRLFAASLQPGRLTVVDTQSGQVVGALPCIIGVSSMRPVPAPSTCSSRLTPTTTQHLPASRSGPGPAARAFISRRASRTALFMSWPNMLPQGGSEIALFYVDD
jgi:hypothetical protein